MILFQGIYLREMKTYVFPKIYTGMFIVYLLLIAPNWKQHKCPSTGEWIYKSWHIVEYYSVIKRNKLVRNMDESQKQYANWIKRHKRPHSVWFHSKDSLLLLLLGRFSHVRLRVTPKTAVHQAPLSLGFSRQEYWSGLPFPSPMHACLWSCATLWTAAHQAPLTMGFSRQEYWSGLPYPSPKDSLEKAKA